MSQLETIQPIAEAELDQKYYFQSLFQKACQKNLFTETQIERIQLELAELMGKEIIRYTNDESSSVPIEKAQDILQSITYCIGYLLKTTTDMTQKLDMLKKEKITVLFYRGMEEISSCFQQTKKMLNQLHQNCHKLENYAYHDTIFIGLPEFFHDYNIEFEAHDNPGCIDYPLINTITERIGIEFISEYITRLSLEQRFLNFYSQEVINRLLTNYDKESEHLLINIYELVLINAVGCQLAGQNPKELALTNADLIWLGQHLQHQNPEELTVRLRAAFTALKNGLGMDEDIAGYTWTAIPNLAVRLYNNLMTGTLKRFFIAYDIPEMKEAVYKDGIPMEDEELRQLIERMKEIRTTAEKIAILRNAVRSQADFIELLNECFYEVEYESVLRTLTAVEKEILKKGILQEYGQDYLEEPQNQREWQKQLFHLPKP